MLAALYSPAMETARVKLKNKRNKLINKPHQSERELQRRIKQAKLREHNQ